MKDEATYEGLARRYRPATFDDVVGQRHIVQTLQRAIKEKRWSPAYLLIGGRGLGKTTMARLLAKGINCEKGPTESPCLKCESCQDIAAGRDLDVLEIDAASNTGVDNVRDVIIQAVGTAAVRGYAKVFIIDEVHMLSTAAFNALLKTIEEPPSRVLFILATTEGHKVPATIRSRCQRFDFRPIMSRELVARLEEVSKKEKIKVDGAALELISDHAEGGVRDALSALDLVAAFASEKITPELVEEALGLVSHLAIEELMKLFEEGDAEAVYVALERLCGAGADPHEIMRSLMNAFRRELHAEFSGRKSTTARFSRGRIVRSLEAIIASLDRSRYARHPQLELEILMCRLTAMAEEEVSLREIYDRLTDESQHSGGAVSPSGVVPQPRVGAAVKSLPKPVDSPKRKEEKTASSSVPAGSSSPSHIPSQRDPATESEKAMIAVRGISSMAGALLADAVLRQMEGDNYSLEFLHEFHMNRYRKEKQLQATVIKELCRYFGKSVILEVSRRAATARGAENTASELKREVSSSATGKPALSRDRKAADIENDPEIEKIKEIFKADVVEIIKG